MGYDLKRFVDQLSVPHHLRCLICNLILEDPLQSPCEHNFCNQCITIYLNQSTNHCPHYEEDSVSVKSDKKKSPLRKMSFRKIIGKSPKETKLPVLKLSDLKSVPDSLLEELNSLKVYCDFNANGCEEQLSLVNLKEHVKRCKFVDSKPEKEEEADKQPLDSTEMDKKDTAPTVETRVDSTEVKRKNSENKSVNGEEEVGSDDFVVIPNQIKAGSTSTKSTESVQTTSSKENVNKEEEGQKENVEKEKKKKKKKKKAKNQDGETASLKGQDSGQNSEASSKTQSKESLVSTGAAETEEVKRALKDAEAKTENLRLVNTQLLGQINDYRTQIQKLKEEHNLQSKLETGEVDELKNKIQHLEKDNKSQALRIIQLLDSNEQMNKFIMDLREEQSHLQAKYNSTLNDVQKTLSLVQNCKQVS